MYVNRRTLLAELQRFEHESFLPGQEYLIRAVLEGRDVLAVLPTGAGKSLVYQLAAQFLPGLTLVVSPLLALMKDQVDSIEERGIPAGVITSRQGRDETAEELEEVDEGAAKLLYVTPERFANETFMATVRDQQVSLFVVDEAHCISEWGHDFRPAYLGLRRAIEQVGRPAILALTATATPWVRSEIVERLGMREPDIVVHGIDRPNLFFEVVRVEHETDDRTLLRGLLAAEPRSYPEEIQRKLAAAMSGCGIVYVRTTRAAEETAGWLREWGIEADFYHGQRSTADRERVQDAFMCGGLRVIAATNAFGLGVDKPDIRFVIHRDIPASIEAYYQEAGRAGRDGHFARCAIIYRPADLARAAFLSAISEFTREEVERARAVLLRRSGLTVEELGEASGLSRAHVARLVATLTQQGILREQDGGLHLLVRDFDPEHTALRAEERRKAYERSRVEMMRNYAESTACRRGFLLNYFGEEPGVDRCELCDNDVLQRAGEPVTQGQDAALPIPFRVGDRVRHDSWGAGTVQRVTADTVTVLFEEVGYKTLATAIVEERGLLKPTES